MADLPDLFDLLDRIDVAVSSQMSDAELVDSGHAPPSSPCRRLAEQARRAGVEDRREIADTRKILGDFPPRAPAGWVPPTLLRLAARYGASTRIPDRRARGVHRNDVCI